MTAMLSDRVVGVLGTADAVAKAAAARAVAADWRGGNIPDIGRAAPRDAFLTYGEAFRLRPDDARCRQHLETLAEDVSAHDVARGP